MKAFSLRSLPFLLLGALCAAQVVQPPEVLDRTLANGVKVLMVDRPGTGAAHVELFLQGGRAATGNLTPASADLLARTLFRRLAPAGADPDLDLNLRQEGTAYEALRLERLRQARRPDRAPSPELSSLQAMHTTALAAIREKLGPTDTWDALDDLGASHRTWEASADYLATGMDLPSKALKTWCALEAWRLGRPSLARFPLERERLLQELDAGKPPCPPSLSVLLSMALAGRPYALVSEFHRSDVEALTAAELAGLCRSLVVTERLVLVLVGDLAHDTLLPELQRTFGALPRSAAQVEDPAPFRDDDPGSTLESPAGRKLLVSTTGELKVLFGWRVPPLNYPDGPALRALAQILAGSPSSRLNQGLVTTRGLARTLTLDLGVPGERDVNLMVITAEPAQGHSLDELEQALEGEVLRLQREPLPEAEVRRAQVQMEAQEILVQEDATTLAHVLGVAHCQAGDWRTGFRALSAVQDLRPAEIQTAARTYLVPARVTIARFGPDPLLLPLDRTEGRLLQVLSALVQRRLTDPVQAQSVLREAIRQLRMLSPAEREQTLKLLEAQVAP